MTKSISVPSPDYVSNFHLNTSVDKPKSCDIYSTPLNVIKEESSDSKIKKYYEDSDDEDFLD